MERTLNWLNENKLINALIAAAFFLAVVTFHDEVTVVAIKIRRAFSVTGYNLLFTSLTILGFTAWVWWVLRKVIKQRRFGQLFVYFLPSLVLIGLFFLYMQTYAIEAIHFFQYAILAFLLFPLLRS